jgi:hypothetical protein
MKNRNSAQAPFFVSSSHRCFLLCVVFLSSSCCSLRVVPLMFSSLCSCSLPLHIVVLLLFMLLLFSSSHCCFFSSSGCCSPPLRVVTLLSFSHCCSHVHATFFLSSLCYYFRYYSLISVDTISLDL